MGPTFIICKAFYHLQALQPLASHFAYMALPCHLQDGFESPMKMLLGGKEEALEGFVWVLDAKHRREEASIWELFFIKKVIISTLLVRFFLVRFELGFVV